MNPALVLLNNCSHNGQTQARTAGFTRTRGVGAVEALEHALAVLTVNTGAVVAHLQHGEREAGNLFAHAHRNLQGRAVGGVAHGVGQQVRYDLTQA